MAINYTILDKLKEINMSEKYIEKFHHSFQENTLKVIPKTIIEKIGNITNLRNIIMKCFEILYLDHSMIDQFTPAQAEHVVNGVINFIHDKEDQIKIYSEEIKFKFSMDTTKYFFLKKTALQVMIDKKVETQVAYRIVEQFENYRFYLFPPSVNISDETLIELLVQKFHDNSEINGFFLDPSEENAIDFIKKTLSTLYSSTYLNDYCNYLNKKLKIKPNRRFIVNLKEFLKKNINISEKYQIAEFEYKFFIIQSKLNIISQNSFQTILQNLDSELNLIKADMVTILKTAQLPRGIIEADIIDYIPFLRDLFGFCFNTSHELYNVYDMQASSSHYHLKSQSIPIVGYILKTYFENKNIPKTSKDPILECISIVFAV